MDWRYLYAFLTFAIGALAGFQGIYDRFKKDSISASKTSYGILYLFSRGIFPAVIFLLLYGSQVFESRIPLWAIICGTSFEAIFRAKFFIKEEQKDGGTVDLLKGPFDLLHWYQNYMLEETAISLAGSRKDFIKSNLPEELPFLELCNRVSRNLHAYPQDQKHVRRGIQNEIRKLKDKHNDALRAGADSEANIDQQYREQLGYMVLNNAGERGFFTLLKQ